MTGVSGSVGARLPAHYERATIDLGEHAPWLIASLFEEGDSVDLRWLASRFDEDRLRAWLRDRGERQLSRRSHAFWSLVLGLPRAAADNEPPGEALWPS